MRAPRFFGISPKLAKALLVTVWFLCSSVQTKALAEPPSETTPIKLGALLEEAKEKNAELRALEAEVRVKEAQIGPRGAYEDPMLGVEAMNYPVNSFSAGRYGMTGVQVSLTQRIPFPGKLTRLVDSARLEVDEKKAAARQKELTLFRDVKVLYFDLFAAYKKKDLLAEQRAVLGQILAVTRSNFALGKSPEAEVLSLQVELATLLDDSLTVDAEIERLLGDLNHQLGRADHGKMERARPAPIVKTKFDFVRLTEPVVLGIAVRNSPELRAKEAKRKVSDEMLSYAKWSYLPDFTFKLGYTFRQPSPMDNGTDFVSGMVGITLPIWAAAKQSEEVRGAAAEKVKAEALLEDQRHRLAHEVHASYATLAEAHERIKLYESGVLPLVRQSVVAGLSGYATGKVSYATLLNLLTKRYRAETSYYEALATYESKIAELDAVAGAELEGTSS